MKSLKSSIPIIVSTVLLSTGAMFGQTAATDSTFAKKAAAGGMAEVKLGRLAQNNGASGEVKEFGKRMETDHSKAGDQLKDVASKHNIKLPSDIGKEDQATYERLSRLKGAEFDREYARDMVSDHEKDIADFEAESRSGKNPDVKTFASETLPTLQDHLKQAKAMQKSVTGTESRIKAQ